MTRIRPAPLFAAALLAACSQEQPADETPSPTATPAALAAVAGREFKYTSLKDCPLLKANPDEAGYFESECPGEGGYKLRVIESDLRQAVTVISPGGTSAALDLSALTGGGFSKLGDTVEWRGMARRGGFTPDALILRHAVATDPEGGPDISWLVAVKLASTPCAVATIKPGPAQNENARSAADAGGDCLSGSA
jgi:hypothetical protein